MQKNQKKDKNADKQKKKKNMNLLDGKSSQY